MIVVGCFQLNYSFAFLFLPFSSSYYLLLSLPVLTPPWEQRRHKGRPAAAPHAGKGERKGKRKGRVGFFFKKKKKGSLMWRSRLLPTFTLGKTEIKQWDSLLPIIRMSAAKLEIVLWLSSSSVIQLNVWHLWKFNPHKLWGTTLYFRCRITRSPSQAVPSC